MSKCFTGFDGFDCLENIWRGVFGANKHGGSKRLRAILSIDESVLLDDAVFSRKLKGDNAWSGEVEEFLKYSEKPEVYKTKWKDSWASPPGCLEVFRKFIASVSSAAVKGDQMRFLPAARKVSAYLESILQHCSDHSSDSDEWIAAGMYVLTAFFLQNGKSVIPQCYYPPREYDPVKVHEQGTVIIPKLAMHEPDAAEYQFDFLEYIRQEFAEMFLGGNTGLPENSFSPDIAPAQIRRKCEHFSCDFRLKDQKGLISRAFAVEEYLVKGKNQWYPMLKFRALPYTEEYDCEDLEHAFQHEADYFIDDPMCHGVILTAKEDGSSSFLNSYMISVSQPETGDLFVSKASQELGRVHIDKNGFPLDPDLETLFADFGFEPTAQQASNQTVQWRKATSKFRPDYLRYLILDLQTMKEIPKSFSRNPSTGEYQMHLMIPCPGVLGITEAVFDEEINSDILAVSGYLHGHYGLKQNPKAAEQLMEKGAQAGDPQMAFEYGTLLMQNGRIPDANKCLRFAADKNIPGAQFELARLLKEHGTTSDTIEAAQLIHGLLQQGYRTYGTEPIDFFEYKDYLASEINISSGKILIDNRYEIRNVIGEGGFGITYQAIDLNSRKSIAIKLSRCCVAKVIHLHRFLIGKTNGQLCAVFDASRTADNGMYIAMEWIKDYMPLDTISHYRDFYADLNDNYRIGSHIHILIDLLQGVKCLHDLGIIHSDINPSNVLTNGYSAKLIDYSSSFFFDEDQNSSAYRNTIILDGVHCPEQEEDFRSDLYSVGMVAFRWLTGSIPNRDCNHKILMDDLDMDPQLQAILTKAAAYNPDDRYQTAEAFIDALETYLDHYTANPA